MSLLVAILILAGVFFLAVGAIGVLRFPDVFTRAHALSVTDTLGAFFVLLGLACHYGVGLNTVKIGFILVFLLLFNPVVAHATLRAALRAGLKPWTINDP